MEGSGNERDGRDGRKTSPKQISSYGLSDERQAPLQWNDIHSVHGWSVLARMAAGLTQPLVETEHEVTDV